MSALSKDSADETADTSADIGVTRPGLRIGARRLTVLADRGIILNRVKTIHST
jgi:hypothetical protein